MSITDQALKKLETGLTLGWNLNPKLKARATEIIESLAKQLEAKGDLTEEYKRGYQDGVREATELREKNNLQCMTDCKHNERGRFCTLPVGNHCARSSEDYYTPKGE